MGFIKIKIIESYHVFKSFEDDFNNDSLFFSCFRNRTFIEIRTICFINYKTINASQEKNKVQVYGEKNYTDDAMADVQSFLLKDNMPIVLKDGFRKKKLFLFLRKELSSWFKKHNEPFSGIFNYRSIVNFECFLSRYNDFYSRLN